MSKWYAYACCIRQEQRAWELHFLCELATCAAKSGDVAGALQHMERASSLASETAASDTQARRTTSIQWQWNTDQLCFTCKVVIDLPYPIVLGERGDRCLQYFPHIEPIRPLQIYCLFVYESATCHQCIEVYLWETVSRC